MNVNISWFNILVLQLFRNKNGLMAKLYNTLIMLKIVFMHVHCIRLCMLETYSYNNVSHTIEFFIYFNPGTPGYRNTYKKTFLVTYL